MFFLFLDVPENCSSFYNFSVECVNNAWLDAGCLEDGSKAPYALTSYQLDTIKSKNLRFVYYISFYC